MGDAITFGSYCYNLLNVVRVIKYPDFAEMLDIENFKFVIPNKTKCQAYDMLAKNIFQIKKN